MVETAENPINGIYCRLAGSMWDEPFVEVTIESAIVALEAYGFVVTKPFEPITKVMPGSEPEAPAPFHTPTYAERAAATSGTIADMAEQRRRLRGVHSTTLVTPEVRTQSIERWRVEDRALLAYEEACKSERSAESEALAYRMSRLPPPGLLTRLWRALWGQS